MSDREHNVVVEPLLLEDVPFPEPHQNVGINGGKKDREFYSDEFGSTPTRPRRYTRLVSRTGHLNISVSRTSWFSQFNLWSPYHAVLNLPWWQLLLVSALYASLLLLLRAHLSPLLTLAATLSRTAAVTSSLIYPSIDTFPLPFRSAYPPDFSFSYWVSINLIFALLYYADVGHLDAAQGFQDAFFFSLQTMSTVGYGNLNPRSLYLQIVVTLQTWLGLVIDSMIVAVMISKVARPSRLRHTVKFSDVATINVANEAFVPAPVPTDALMGFGSYTPGTPATPTLSFRLANLRKRQLCAPQLRVYLLMQDGEGARRMYELDYEMAQQVGRPRSVNYALPHLVRESK